MPTEHMPANLVEFANIFYDKLAAYKVDRILIPDPSTGLRLGNLARAYVQSHIWRCLSFIESGYAEFREGRLLTVYSCARATYENVAAICDFVETLKPLVDAEDYVAVGELVHSRALATRIPSFAKKTDSYFAVQVLKQIDRLDKKHPGYREAYDHLCDTAHPNALGTVAYFCDIQDDVASFSNGSRDQSRAIISLVSATIKIGHAVVALEEFEGVLNKPGLRGRPLNNG